MYAQTIYTNFSTLFYPSILHFMSSLLLFVNGYLLLITKTNTYQFKLTTATITSTLTTTNILTPRRNEASHDIDSLHRFPLIKKVRLPPSIYIYIIH